MAGFMSRDNLHRSCQFSMSGPMWTLTLYTYITEVSIKYERGSVTRLTTIHADIATRPLQNPYGIRSCIHI